MNEKIRLPDYNEYRKLLKSGISGAYLICGEEEFLMDSMLSMTRSYITDDKTLAAFNILHFSATSADFDYSAVYSAMQSPPMFTDKKLVELHDVDFNSLKPENVLEHAVNEITEIASLAGDDTIFLLCCRSDEFSPLDGRGQLTPLAKRLSESFTIFSDDLTEGLSQWMTKHFNSNGVSCDGKLLKALTDRCGHSMFILSSEIEKLCEYVLSQGRNSVQREDIAEVTIEYTEFGDFDFADAIIGRNYKRAQAIFEAKKKDHIAPELILGTITKIFSDMIMVYELNDCGLNSGEIEKRLGIHKYPLSKSLGAIRNTDHDRLCEILDRCLEADTAVKRRGGGDEYLPIDRLIAECTR